MHARLVTRALVVLIFALGSSGCSKSLSIDPNSDPGQSSAPASFDSGEPVKISGYTRVSDGYRRWKGTVRLSAPDSLAFAPSSTHHREPFVLHSSEVASFDMIVPDKSRTATARTVAAFVAIAGGAAVAYVIAND